MGGLETMLDWGALARTKAACFRRPSRGQATPFSLLCLTMPAIGEGSGAHGASFVFGIGRCCKEGGSGDIAEGA